MAGCQCPLRHPPHPRLLNGSSVQILTLAIAIAVAAPEAPSVELARHDGGNIQRPAWSPDGFKLSYEANYHERKVIELYVGDTDGEFTRVRPDDSSLGSLTAGFSSRSSAGKVSHEISWSPPAIGRFVYTASSNNMDYDLYIDGGGALSPSPQADGGAAWSPGGNHIVFTSARTGQAWQVLGVRSRALPLHGRWHTSRSVCPSLGRCGGQESAQRLEVEPSRAPSIHRGKIAE